MDLKGEVWRLHYDRGRVDYIAEDALGRIPSGGILKIPDRDEARGTYQIWDFSRFRDSPTAKLREMRRSKTVFRRSTQIKGLMRTSLCTHDREEVTANERWREKLPQKVTTTIISTVSISRVITEARSIVLIVPLFTASASTSTSVSSSTPTASAGPASRRSTTATTTTAAAAPTTEGGPTATGSLTLTATTTTAEAAQWLEPVATNPSPRELKMERENVGQNKGEKEKPGKKSYSATTQGNEQSQDGLTAA